MAQRDFKFSIFGTHTTLKDDLKELLRYRHRYVAKPDINAYIEARMKEVPFLTIATVWSWMDEFVATAQKMFNEYGNPTSLYSSNKTDNPAYYKEYYQANKEQIREKNRLYQAEYRRKKKDKISEIGARYWKKKKSKENN